MEYLADRLCGLCYERSWYSKLGGCEAISVLISCTCSRWLLEHQYSCLRALMFVITDLAGEVRTSRRDPNFCDHVNVDTVACTLIVYIENWRFLHTNIHIDHP